MPDRPDSKTRASRLRERIAERKNRKIDKATARDAENGPKPGESPHAYVERRMRETVKKE